MTLLDSDDWLGQARSWAPISAASARWPCGWRRCLRRTASCSANGTPRIGQGLLALAHLFAGEHVEQFDGFEVRADGLANHVLKLACGHGLVHGEGQILLDRRERGDRLGLDGLAGQRGEQRGEVQLEGRGMAGKPSASLTRGCSSPTQPVKTSPP